MSRKDLQMIRDLIKYIQTEFLLQIKNMTVNIEAN